ncbi:response regulator transcription factor [Winogradskyella ursingii]|uniref:response regulator transcription factor n=1 Tax=Winogradskyella ursingii TaxID=2686079 RepID=UPI001C549ECF|nr:LuxR C-terminal-related transcriptional regulator [Winogradskyella ursingii]
MLAASDENSELSWNFYLISFLIISLIANTLLFLHIHKIRQSKTEDLKQRLSKQEQVVLEQILQNKTNKDIAEDLFLSVSTVKTHINNIYKKLNVQSRDDAKSLFIK